MFVDIHALLRLLYTKTLSIETMRNRWFHSVGSLSELKNANGEDKLPKKQTNILWAAPGNRMPFLARNYFIRVNHHPICHWSCFVEMRRINHLIAPGNVWNVFVANSLIASSHAKHSHNYINSVWFKTKIGPIRSTNGGNRNFGQQICPPSPITTLQHFRKAARLVHYSDCSNLIDKCAHDTASAMN